MKKKILLSIGAVILFSAAIWWFAFKAPAEDQAGIFVSPKKGTFAITVTSTGELVAKNSKDIRGPQGGQRFNIYQIKISNLVAEGTQVKAGDFVADLEQSEIA